MGEKQQKQTSAVAYLERARENRRREKVKKRAASGCVSPLQYFQLCVLLQRARRLFKIQ
jgi:hypothetical protein